jgi:hypothetical protein
MLTKDWFVDTLTPNQLTELQLIWIKTNLNKQIKYL